MSNPYIAQDVLDQCREALRQGKTLETLAGILRCEADHLARLLGLPASPPAGAGNTEFDLWSIDRLNEVL